MYGCKHENTELKGIVYVDGKAKLFYKCRLCGDELPSKEVPLKEVKYEKGLENIDLAYLEYGTGSDSTSCYSRMEV